MIPKTKTTENQKQNKNRNELSQWSLKPSVSLCSYLTNFSVIRRSPGIGRIVVHYHESVGLVSCKSDKTRKFMLRASQNIQHFKNQPCYRKAMSIWKSIYLKLIFTVGCYPRFVGRYRKTVGRYRTKVPTLESTWSGLLRTSKITRIDPIVTELCWLEKITIFSNRFCRKSMVFTLR